MKKSVTIYLLVLALLCLTVSTVYATPQTLTVQILQKWPITLNLSRGASVSGAISVASGDINLLITDPNGNLVANYSRVSSQSFSFTANMDGAYILTLDNSHSLSSKSVNIDYSVQNSFLGINQNIIIMFAVVLAILIAAVFGTRYMAKRPKKSILDSGEINFFTKQKIDKSMVYCPKCGTLNSKEDNFCKKCGKNIAMDNKTVDEDLEKNKVTY